MSRFLLILSSISLLILASCQHRDKEAAESAVFNITTPIIKDTLIFREYVCQIRSINHIELRSQERGYLQKIYVDEGQHVRKGQLMFQIMPVIYQAEMAKAKAEMNFAEIEYKNTKSLADNNVVSPNELALSKAKLDKAAADLSLAKAHLDFTEIHAPFDGIMDRFQTRIGSLVDEGELLTTLSDNSRLWVYFNVPEVEYLNYMRAGKSDSARKVRLQLANKDIFEYTGTVETIEADFNNETGNIAFRATFPNPRGLLRHGETGNILMPVPLRQAILIPQQATFEILDKKYVFVVNDQQQVQTRQITVGEELPHIYAVVDGLKPTDKILLEGLQKVKNNDKIRTRMVDPATVLSGLHELHAE